MRTAPLRLAASVSLLGVPLAGCAAGTDAPSGSASAPAAAALETTSATPELSAGASGIPASGLLQPADAAMDDPRHTDAGDQSVLVRIDQKESYAGEKKETVSRYAALARAGDVIVVIADLGWENTGGSEELARELISRAVERAGTID
jgi:hypothetical protein